MRTRVMLGISALVLALTTVGLLVATIAIPDEAAPPEVLRILPAAKRYLAGQLDLVPPVVRYVGWEHWGDDELIILRFEIRTFPFVVGEGAYLASRCVPIEDLEPASMSGGRGVSNFDTDAELEFLRSDAQPACD